MQLNLKEVVRYYFSQSSRRTLLAVLSIWCLTFSLVFTPNLHANNLQPSSSQPDFLQPNIVTQDRPAETQVITISLPDEASVQAASPERFQQLVNFLQEYWQIWAIDNQMSIRFVYLTTADALKMLRQGKVDVVAITSINPTVDDLLFSIPYAKFEQRIYRNLLATSNNTTKVAILDETKTSLKFLPSHIERQYFSEVDELAKHYKDFNAIYAIRPWQLEIMLDELGVRQQFHINKEEVPDLSIHFTLRKDSRELMSLINDSIRLISQEQANLWRGKYFSGENNNFVLTLGKFLPNLTEEEKNYLIDTNVIKYPVSPNGFPPFIIGQNYSNVTYRGFSIDLLDKVSDKLGLQFVPLRVDSIAEVENSINSGTADLFAFAEVVNLGETKYRFTQPYLPAKYSAFYNPNQNSFARVSDIDNARIAIVKNYQVSQLVQKRFPSAQFFPFDNEQLAIAEVARGGADVFIGRSLTASYIVKQEGFANLTAIPLSSFRPDAKFAFGALPENQALIEMINKALKSFTDDEMDALYAKWSHTAFPEADVQGQVADAYRQASYLFLTILLIALIVFWIYYRQLQIRKLAQKKIEHALAIAEAARSEAEKSAQAKITFLARMSHEIRTPMNGVLGMAEALSYSTLNKEQEELLDTLEGSARHLLALLNDVLDFSKMDAGKLTLESVPVNMHLLANNAIKSFHHVKTERQLALELDIDNNITHSYYTDPTRLNQVLNNLISNAIKFTEKGRIVLSIKRIAQRAEKVDIYDTIRISVKDSGIGISPEQQVLLFSPFIQADSDITRKFGGTGLGLSICQEIVSAMGGQIQVNSDIGQGSEFFFDLTFKEAGFERETVDRRKRNRISQPPPDDRFKDMRVLVAEDNLVNVKVLTAQLERIGINADVAYDGQQALEKHIELPYDIIISDCHMPNMDGFELAKRLSKDKGSGLWLIAVTADALSGAAEKCLAAGFDDYMAKPCPQEEITNKLNHGYRALLKSRLTILKTIKQSEHPAIFHPEILVHANGDKLSVALEKARAFSTEWPQEKRQLLIHLDNMDTLELTKVLKRVARSVRDLEHDKMLEIVNHCTLEFANADSGAIQDNVLALCSNLDLFFVEVMEWLSEHDFQPTTDALNHG